MRQRHVVACLWGIAGLWVFIIVGAFVVMNLIRHDKPKFIEPVIWRVPYTGGAPQFQPEI